MIRAAILEDERHACDALLAKLGRTKLEGCASYTCFEDGDALLHGVRDGQCFDMAFMDIELPGLNGIEVGKALHEADPRCIIVFVTNYPQYAVDAFDCEAFHYLLKDCTDEHFAAVIGKVLEKYTRSHRQCTLKTGSGVRTLGMADICFVECVGRRLLYHTESECVEVRQLLRDAAAVLLPFGFFEVHQGYLVNLGKIRSIEGNEAVLEGGKTVMISARRRGEVVKAYLDYLERMM